MSLPHCFIVSELKAQSAVMAVNPEPAYYFHSVALLYLNLITKFLLYQQTHVLHSVPIFSHCCGTSFERCSNINRNVVPNVGTTYLGVHKKTLPQPKMLTLSQRLSNVQTTLLQRNFVSWASRQGGNLVMCKYFQFTDC